MITYILDALVLISGFVCVAFFVMSGLQGLIGRSFVWILAGLTMMTFAHISETIMFQIFQVDAEFNEISHRAIVLMSFALITYGFYKIKEALK